MLLCRVKFLRNDFTIRFLTWTDLELTWTQMNIQVPALLSGAAGRNKIYSVVSVFPAKSVLSLLDQKIAQQWGGARHRLTCLLTLYSESDIKSDTDLTSVFQPAL